jgi:hypothetical protein
VHLRNKRTGAIISAALELCPNRGNGTHFAVRLWLPDGHCRLIGRMESAIGYELVAWNTPELAALILAGFRIGRADKKLKPSTISPLVSVLHLPPRKTSTPARKIVKPKARKESSDIAKGTNRASVSTSNSAQTTNWLHPSNENLTTCTAGR